MTEYIVKWDIGYGKNYEVVEANDEDEAHKKAYELWCKAVVGEEDYDVIGIATDELKKAFDL